MQPPESPCIKVCVLDAGGYCSGCLRTLDEIARWGAMGAEAQWRLLATLAERRKRQSGARVSDAPPAPDVSSVPGAA